MVRGRERDKPCWKNGGGPLKTAKSICLGVPWGRIQFCRSVCQTRQLLFTEHILCLMTWANDYLPEPQCLYEEKIVPTT